MTDKTRFIRVKFLRNGETVGQPYTYKTDLDVQIGETIMITEKVKGIIIGFATMSMVVNPDDVKEIFGQIEKEVDTQ